MTSSQIETKHLLRTLLGFGLGLVLVIVVSPKSSFAADEYWQAYQLRQGLTSEDSLFLEYVQRDRQRFFGPRQLSLVRLSYGHQFGAIKVLAGGAYLDFASSPSELRLHQFALHSALIPSVAGFYFRWGLEQRRFEGDPTIYFRLRGRIQMNLRPQDRVGLAVYNEAFLMANGHERFASGFNENRFGVGLRLNTSVLDFYLYQVAANLQHPSGWKTQSWIQFQILAHFD